MKQTWKRRGQLFAPGFAPWSKYYGMLPTPVLESPDRLRLYFGTTDDNNDGRIAFMDVSPNDPKHILTPPTGPVLEPGITGAFDDCGAVPSSYLRMKDEEWMYYSGFQRADKCRAMIFLGLSIRKKGETSFSRVSTTPLLDRLGESIALRAGAVVLPTENGYRMWYLASTGWADPKGKPVPTYEICTLTSRDGRKWEGRGEVCIAPQTASKGEIGFSRPWVEKSPDGFRMWYSVRSHKGGVARYENLGYAESSDGVHWTRHDDWLTLEGKPEAWESEMVCYPAFFSHAGRSFLFYCGNGNGRSGFGLAELA